jgi:HptB-dependent secretion and biofilm anti anti-sigma factor
MKFESAIEDRAGILTLEGPFTFEAHTPFRAHVQRLLGEAGLQRLVIDLSRVGHMDYSSMGLLLLIRETAEKRNLKMVLRRPSPPVLELLDAFHFTRIFELIP